MDRQKQKGFTLVEMVIIIVVLVAAAGLFAVNSTGILNRNRKSEKNNIETIITSAANAYVTSNPESVQDLYNGIGWVDIKLSELKEQGYISDDLKDPETGEPISNDRFVRIEFNNGIMAYSFDEDDEYKELSTVSFALHADDLYVDYNESSSSSSWCNVESNWLSGLYSIYEGDVTKTSLYFVNQNRDKIDPSSHGISIDKTYCDVNPSVPGTYRIDYTFTYRNDAGNTQTGSKSRTVIVNPNQSDLLSFEVISINYGNPIRLGSDKNSVVFSIKEKYRDNTVDNGNRTWTYGELSAHGYSAPSFDTATTTYSNGRYYPRTVEVINNKTNSDGTKIKSASQTYNVTSNLLSVLAAEDCGRSNNCYYKGYPYKNYVRFKNTIYRMYYVNGNNIRIIYNGTDFTGYYGQGGRCHYSMCCNQGAKYYYNLLSNDGGTEYQIVRANSIIDSGYGLIHDYFYRNGLLYHRSYPNPTMHDRLDTFYSSYVGSSSLPVSFATTMHDGGLTSYGRSLQRKVSLLTYDEYNNIAGCSNGLYCPSSYLSNADFWLADNSSHINNYYVTTSGSIATKGQHPLVIKPTMQLNNPTITKGSGSSSDPYIIND